MSETIISHPGVDHAWACRTASGQIGEVQITTLLSEESTSAVVADPTRSEEFCPGGQIVCNSCDFPLIPGEAVQVEQVDLVDLTEHLVAPGIAPVQNSAE